MNEQEQFLQTVLDAIKKNEGTPALVYADWLEENGHDYPEFFRLLGRKVMEYPDWRVVTGMAHEWGGGYWNHSTPASGYVQKTITSAMLATGRQDYESGGWLAFNRQVASVMITSLEVRSLMKSVNTSYCMSMNNWERFVFATFGLPNWIYGCRLHVFDTPVVPNNTAILLNEKNKTLALITEVGWPSV